MCSGAERISGLISASTLREAGLYSGMLPSTEGIWVFPGGMEEGVVDAKRTEVAFRIKVLLLKSGDRVMDCENNVPLPLLLFLTGRTFEENL